MTSHLWPLIHTGEMDVAWDLCEGEGIPLPMDEMAVVYDRYPWNRRHRWARSGRSARAQSGRRFCYQDIRLFRAWRGSKSS